MSLKYDFDIFQLQQNVADADPDLARILDALKTEAAEVDSVALFRDPRTAEALRQAPERLRDFFLASGFGLNTYDSGAPRGRYPAKDEEARLAIIARLTQNAEVHILPKPGDYPEGGEGFRLGEFLIDLASAQPIDMAEAQAEPLVQRGGVVMPPMPPMFDTHADAPEAAPRKKFWQSRYIMVSLIIGAMAVILQVTKLAGVAVFASL